MKFERIVLLLIMMPSFFVFTSFRNKNHSSKNPLPLEAYSLKLTSEQYYELRDQQKGIGKTKRIVLQFQLDKTGTYLILNAYAVKKKKDKVFEEQPVSLQKNGTSPEKLTISNLGDQEIRVNRLEKKIKDTKFKKGQFDLIFTPVELPKLKDHIIFRIVLVPRNGVPMPNGGESPNIELMYTNPSPPKDTGDDIIDS